MAFTDTEKMKIRFYLGWPERFLQSDSALELSIRAIEDTLPESEAQIRTLIGYADTIQADILDSRKRLKAAKADDVTLMQGVEISELRGLGRMYSGQIASLMAVEIRHDIWSPGGPNFRTSGYGGPTGGGDTMSFG